MNNESVRHELLSLPPCLREYFGAERRDENERNIGIFSLKLIRFAIMNIYK